MKSQKVCERVLTNQETSGIMGFMNSNRKAAHAIRPNDVIAPNHKVVKVSDPKKPFISIYVASRKQPFFFQRDQLVAVV